MALTPKLLLVASRLREIAVEGVVELDAVALKAAIGLHGASTRTLRRTLATLEVEDHVRRASDRGPGAKIRLSLVEKRTEKRTVADKKGEKRTVSDTGGGRGWAVLPVVKQEEEAAAARQREADNSGQMTGIAVILATAINNLADAIRGAKAASPPEVSKRDKEDEIAPPTPEEEIALNERAAQLAAKGEDMGEALRRKVLEECRRKPEVLARHLARAKRRAELAARPKPQPRASLPPPGDAFIEAARSEIRANGDLREVPRSILIDRARALEAKAAGGSS